jgi:hypothetical protein
MDNIKHHTIHGLPTVRMMKLQRFWNVALVAMSVLVSAPTAAKLRKQDPARTETLPPADVSVPSLVQDGRSFANVYLAIYGTLDKRVVATAVDQLVNAQPVAACSPWSSMKPWLNDYRVVGSNREILLQANGDNLQNALYSLARNRQSAAPACDQSKKTSLIVSIRISSKTAAQGGGKRVYYIPQVFSANDQTWETIPPQAELYADGGCGRVGQTLVKKLDLDAKLLYLDCPKGLTAECLGDVLKTAAQRAELYVATLNRCETTSPSGNTVKPAALEEKDRQIKALQDQLANANRIINAPKPKDCRACPGPTAEAPTSYMKKHSTTFHVSAAFLGLGLGVSALATGILGGINSGDGGTLTLNPMCGPLQNMSCGAVRHSLGSGVYGVGLSIPLWGITLGAVLLAEFVPGKKATRQSANQGTPPTVSAIPAANESKAPSAASPSAPLPSSAAALPGSMMP